MIETRYAFRYIQNASFKPSIVVARFTDLKPDLVNRVQPELILCPLMGPGFDALDVLCHAAMAEWRASIGVLSPPLPNHRMVERELKAHSGGLSVDLFIV